MLFCYFINAPRNENKIEGDENSIFEIKKNEVNNNNKYVSCFLFSVFKLLEKVRKYYFIVLYS